jgi:Zn-dependent peptidase ImmA (M78 family)
LIELPQRIRVGPAVYQIVRENMKDDMGNCNSESTLIRIDSDMNDFRERSTLLHEILHACSTEFNANASEKAEESCVRAHESGLMCIAIDHPEILKLIFKL